MTQRICMSLTAIVALLWQTSHAQSPDEALVRLMDQCWAYWLQQSPTLLTRLGLRDNNHFYCFPTSSIKLVRLYPTYT